MAALDEVIKMYGFCICNLLCCGVWLLYMYVICMCVCINV